jgi:hypothetical protein
MQKHLSKTKEGIDRSFLFNIKSLKQIRILRNQINKNKMIYLNLTNNLRIKQDKKPFKKISKQYQQYKVKRLLKKI